MECICACHRPVLPRQGDRALGAVHSVFRRAINLKMEDGRLFTLSLSADGTGPYALITDGPALPEGCRQGEPVFLSREALQIGKTVLPIRENAPYTLNRGHMRGDPRKLRENLKLLRRRLERAGPEKDMDPFALAAMEQLEIHRQALKRAVISGEAGPVISAGRSLIGLGQGLTPSGDDLLTGMFLVLGLEGSPFPDADSLLGSIISGCMDSTTDVSWQMLTAAAAGWYKIVLVCFAEALYGDEDRLLPAMERVLSIGHSSGRDLLLGSMTACEVLLNYYQKIGE